MPHTDHLHSVLLLGPPYRDLTAADPQEPFQPGEGGWVMTWNLGTPGWKSGAGIVGARAAGVSLAMVLPDGEDRLSVVRILRAIDRSRPQAVLPHHEAPSPREIASVIRREPVSLANSVTDYLAWRGFAFDGVTRSIIRRTIELSSEVHTVTELAKHLYMSRRALGRRLARHGLPSPSHWLHVARVLRAAIRLQNSDASLFTVAVSLGYTDGFSLSNQMNRLCGIRPLEVRERLGWEWVFEHWLARESAAGSVPGRILDHRASIAAGLHVPPTDGSSSTSHPAASSF